MARLFGGNADVVFDSVALEGELESMTLNFSVTTGGVTAFSDPYTVVVAGKKNTTLDVSGSLSTTSGEGDATIFGAIGAGVKDLVVEPGGGSASANNPSYQCSASGLAGTLVSSYSISLPVGDRATYTASFQCSQNTTRETS